MHTIAAVVFVVVLAGLVVFQLALASGRPWGRFAWGGRHEGVLPRGLRVASAVSVLVYALLGVVVLDRAGLVDVLPDGASRVAAWVVAGYLGLGVLMNLASRSRSERAVMTPVAAVLCGAAVLVALGPA
ncbi:hypothetical protein GXB85_03755 [Cellulomonas sp. APG4]|uniref:hypothetical protein n=1 Tax=Cellulomonas sp. APG4 TaxID=1538656 RepID=UPI0013797C07|nr:hypothetical protein [Cellulomonas sp. APG4]